MASAIQRMSLLILVSTQCCLAANIFLLFFPTFSHITGPANVAKVLQDQGHNVTIAIPSSQPLLQKLKGKGPNILVYDSLGDLDVGNEIERGVLKGYSRMNLFKEISDKVLRDQQFLENIQAHRPDLIILESTPLIQMWAVIPYKLGIPFMFLGSVNSPHYSRTPILPSVVPYKILDFTDQMTFQQRLFNTWVQFEKYFHDPFTLSDVHIYAPEKPYISMYDLQAKALLWIIIDDSILGYSAPSMTNVKQISHLLTVTPIPLPPKFHFSISKSSIFSFI